MKAASDPVIDWLLAGDPAIRWQTLGDLVGAAPATVERERRKVATDGWGARLLALQGEDGRWAAGAKPDSGLYSPKWISTTYTMLLLRDFGLEPTDAGARKACALLLDRGLQKDGGINYGWWGSSETCVTGMVLSLLSYFAHEDDRLDVVADHLLEQQMADGGWNCQRPRGATHSSVHTTISVLEGLRWYEQHRKRKTRTIREAQRLGREFLLAHRMYRSHLTGAVIKPIFTRLSFPPRWHYDILRGLDHFRAVDAPRDERLSDAIGLLREKRHRDGRWRLENRYRGKTYFKLERIHASSRWNTLRALRVLKWWDGSGGTGGSTCS
jgi:hypothetical protein